VAEAFAFLLLQQVNHDRQSFCNTLIVANDRSRSAVSPSTAAFAT